MSQHDPAIPNESLPTRSDFNPWGLDALDAEYAWDMFGGLTLDEARAKFLECPESRQEDFMFMGGRAFAYYFPIIEEYLLGVPEIDPEGDDYQAWILAMCIKNQLLQSTREHVANLLPRIVALSKFMRNNIQRFSGEIDEQKSISKAWAELEEVVKGTQR